MELWFILALGSALFAALKTVVSKIGLQHIDSKVATVVNTSVVLLFTWGIVLATGVLPELAHVSAHTHLFLALSGLSTGLSWLCSFKALQLGNVNKVVPISKSSTILTILMAVVFLGEPLTLISVLAIAFIALGTYLMIKPKNVNEFKESKTWMLYAIGTAAFASLTAIFGSLGIESIDANLGTAIRTVPVLPLALLMVYLTRHKDSGKEKNLRKVNARGWGFMILSGLCTGICWLLFYRALQVGYAMDVAPVKKLSILMTMGFARLFFSERFSKKSLVGLAALTVGILLPVVF